MSDSEWVECPHCNGKKMEVPDCEECEGRGWVDDPNGGTMTCPECDGESCSVCGGEGYVAAEQMRAPDAAPQSHFWDRFTCPSRVTQTVRRKGAK